MAKKKKKMTAAQAAAARRDDKPKRSRSTVHVKDNGPRDRGNRLVLVVTIVLVGAIAIVSLVYSLGLSAAMG